MNDLITLYIKTHNITGLKYFGKTKSKDPHKYKGSGVYWTNHINKHGYDVTTEILGQFTDIVECKKVAILFSKNNNIVESKEWANLIDENGINGGFTEIAVKNGRIAADKIILEKYGVSNISQTLEWKINHSAKMKTLWQTGVYDNRIRVDSIFSIINKDPILNAKKKEIFKEIRHQQGVKNSQYGKMWITNGIDSMSILKDSPIPEDWRKGRVIKV